MMNNFEQLYDADYYSSESYRYEQRTAHSLDRINNVFEMLGRDLCGKAVLDVGTGVGTSAIEAARLGAITIGIDYSQTALSLAYSSAANNNISSSFVRCNAGKLPFGSEIFDIAVLGDIVEHLPEETLMSTLVECYRVLSNEGRIIIYTPKREHIFEWLKAHNVLPQDPTHIDLLNMSELLSNVEECSFTVTESYYRPSHYPVFRSIESILAYVPYLKRLFRRRLCIVARK